MEYPLDIELLIREYTLPLPEDIRRDWRHVQQSIVHVGRVSSYGIVSAVEAAKDSAQRDRQLAVARRARAADIASNPLIQGRPRRRKRA